MSIYSCVTIQNIIEMGKPGKPKHAMCCDAGAVDSQGTSQNSLQRAKRKARDAAGVAGRGKRPIRAHEDALMSQMGCSQQVTPPAKPYYVGWHALCRLQIECKPSMSTLPEASLHLLIILPVYTHGWNGVGHTQEVFGIDLRAFSYEQNPHCTV